MSEKIIFHLHELRKYYGQREVLKGITLSFLEGAKIGLIGPTFTSFKLPFGVVYALNLTPDIDTGVVT